MYCNFYDTTGIMIGFDLHKFWGVYPPVPLPVPLTAGYANVAQYYLSPVEEEGTRTVTLTSDGKRMIQGKCKLEYVPHLPVIMPALPHPVMQTVELVLTMVFSSSTPVLRRQCVTGVGQPLAICVASAIGLNLNCGDPVKTPTGGVLNLNSVKTGASWQDLVPTVVDWIIDSVAGKLRKLLSKTFLDKHFKKIVEEPIEESFKNSPRIC